MLRVNRHVIENFNLYILQEIISVIPQLRIGRYNLTENNSIILSSITIHIFPNFRILSDEE